MHRHGRIEAEPPDIYIKEGLDGPPRHGPRLETVSSLPPSRECRTEQSEFSAIARIAYFKPRFQSLECLWMKRYAPLLSSLAPDFEDLVPAGLLVIHDAKPAEFTNPASCVREDSEERSVPYAHGCCRIGRIEQSPAIVRRKGDGLSVTGDRRRRNELAVGRVRAGESVDLQIAEERTKDRDLPDDRHIREAAFMEVITPRGDLVRANRRKLLDLLRRNSGESHKLSEFAGVGSPRLDRR